MTQIAVIGFGYWGKNLIRNFYELGVLATVCDSDPSRQSQVEEQYPGVAFCTDVEKVLCDESIDAVAIATPAVTHFEVASRAMKAGKDVFVEKPLSLTVAEGTELVDIGATTGRVLMVGHILHYHPAIRKLKEIIQKGELGRVEYLYSNRLNIGKFRTEENILWSFAPHDISVMLGLLGEFPDQIVCQGGDYLSTNVADVTMSQFSFPSGTQAHIFVSWLHPFKEQRLVIVGSEKMAVFDDTAEDKLKLYAHRVQWINRIPTPLKAEAEVVDLDTGEPLKMECQHFIDCVVKREQPITDGREGLRVLKVLNGCQEALESKPEAPATQVEEAAPKYYSHETAVIDSGSRIGGGSKVWHYSHVMKNAKIGDGCVIGQNCCISPDVSLGNNVKVQNNVSVYSGTRIEDDVFLGPSCVLTNVSNPRSQVNRQSLYETTIIRQGATVGANATIVCGVEIGRYAFVAAGTVVTKNVPEYALVMGNPGKHVGWMSRHGHRLDTPDDYGVYTCPESGLRYQLESEDVMRCLDLSEETPLPEDQAKGLQAYREYKLTAHPER